MAMKHTSPSIYPLILPALIIFLMSCSKGSGSTTQCRITDIKTSDARLTHMHFDYNGDKKLVDVISQPSNFKKLYIYSGNRIFITNLDSSGSIVGIDTVTLGTNGLVATVIHYIPVAGYAAYDTLSYNSSNELTKFVETVEGSTTEILYTWSNGDIATSANDSIKSKYTYRTDVRSTDGDIFWLGDVMNYGARSIKCAHLIASAGDISYYYTFDAKGKIITEAASNKTDMEIENYTYECN